MANEIKISGCNDCPFCVDHFDYDCVGQPGLRICNLKKSQSGSYDYSVGTFADEPPPTPDWCPIAKSGVFIDFKQ